MVCFRMEKMEMSTIEEMAEEEAKKEKASYQEYVPRFVEIPIAPRFTEGPPATLRRIDLGALAAAELTGKPTGVPSIAELFPTYRGRAPGYRPPEFAPYGGAPTPERKEEEAPTMPGKPPTIIAPPLLIPGPYLAPPTPTPTPVPTPAPTPTPIPTPVTRIEAGERPIVYQPPPTPPPQPLPYARTIQEARERGILGEKPAAVKPPTREQLRPGPKPPPIEKMVW